mmetsp:Transcript_7266/g.17718  ORF Transcript_7266/g.17718 Transcript_7266/m.17718 type:complete len:241 (-) Transcript_7266:152-874(-)
MYLMSNTSLMSIPSASRTSSATIHNPLSNNQRISTVPSSHVFSEETKEMQPRRVSFSENDIVDTVAQTQIVPKEYQQSSTWYLPHELEIFKTEARLSTRAIRNKGISSGANTVATIYNTADFPTRGLEQRICKNRQRNKVLAIWGTLKAQQRNNDPEFIATIARKCSHSATQLAYMEGARDYCEMYNPEEVAPLSVQIERFATQSFPIKLKRKTPDAASPAINRSEVTHTNCRNVRTRTN